MRCACIKGCYRRICIVCTVNIISQHEIAGAPADLIEIFPLIDVMDQGVGRSRYGCTIQGRCCIIKRGMVILLTRSPIIHAVSGNTVFFRCGRGSIISIIVIIYVVGIVIVSVFGDIITHMDIAAFCGFQGNGIAI